MTKGVPDYPQDPAEWQVWIEVHMSIPANEGRNLTMNGRFPVELLGASWRVEFSIEKGYSPSFIPALERNILGFLDWVYGNGVEPNWKKTDTTQ